MTSLPPQFGHYPNQEAWPGGGSRRTGRPNRWEAGVLALGAVTILTIGVGTSGPDQSVALASPTMTAPPATVTAAPLPPVTVTAAPSASVTPTATVTTTETSTQTSTVTVTATRTVQAAAPGRVTRETSAARPAPKVDPVPGKPADVYYANCAAARAAGVAPLYKGQPGYRVGLDRDRDGIACE